ncbi:hypothetical protein [Nocardia tengchongensis]|uniref:hypothetical protein n=1 Tax=Nocardia tengchongensis TaxID=2055889 RepID=UPI00364A0679
MYDELCEARTDWDIALDKLTTPAGTAPTDRNSAPRALVRDHVQAALLLLGVPASPKLITLVDGALGAGVLSGPKMASLRRDERNAFQAATGARAYYICSALTYNAFTTARGPHALSTWPLHQRIIGPHSPLVDRLTATINIATHIQTLPHPTPRARRLLAQIAPDLRGSTDGSLNAVATAARAQLDIHQPDDLRTRHEAAQRAREQALTDLQLLFGR